MCRVATAHDRFTHICRFSPPVGSTSVAARYATLRVEKAKSASPDHAVRVGLRYDGNMIIPQDAFGIVSSTLLFVDADNQAPMLATTLARFLKSIGRVSARAIVAGNNSGDRVKNWESALREALPGIEISCHVAPIRKQSADVRLMFELAPFYHGQPEPSVLLVVFSRDDLFVAAAECLVERGHNVMLVVGATQTNGTLLTDVPVVVLATPQQVAAVSAVAPPKASPAVSSKPVVTAGQADAQLVQAAVAKIRQHLKPNKAGGYAASAVGQVLSQLGHDKATRTKIVKQIPNLKEVGAGSEKRLVF